MSVYLSTLDRINYIFYLFSNYQSRQMTMLSYQPKTSDKNGNQFANRTFIYAILLSFIIVIVRARKKYKHKRHSTQQLYFIYRREIISVKVKFFTLFVIWYNNVVNYVKSYCMYYCIKSYVYVTNKS